MLGFLKRRRSRKSLKPGGGKDFELELQQFNKRLVNKENFSLARYGDGEMIIINGDAIDLSHKYNGEHKYTPGEDQSERQRSLLTQALAYQAAGYFVGIPCPCCVGEEKFFALKEQSGQPIDRLTWANIFVNANYPRFKEHTVAALRQREVVLVCHENAQAQGLPFKVDRQFAVGSNAWIDDYQRLLPELLAYLEEQQKQDQVFLFCAGVLSNLLIHALHQRHPNNTYLDIGSVFDVELGLGKTRKYLKKGKTLKKTCVWR